MVFKRALSYLRSRPRLLAGGIVVLLGLGAGGAGLAIGIWRNVCYDCPSIAQLLAWEPTQSTKIYDRNGELIREIGEQRRTPVAIEDLPDYVPQAFIAIEDRRFYQHDGYDLRGLTRGGFNFLLGRWNEGGGSTITQQLARHMFTQEVGFEQSPARKFKELKVARELEIVYTKDEILEAYINQILYNSRHGWWGIESAARNYFGKAATEVNPAEAAMLAAVINSPGNYSPFSNPERAESRRNLVLEVMARQGYLTRDDAERWKQHPLPAQPEEDEGGGQIAPYFVEWVRDQLDDRYGPDLYRRGFRIHTTLDVEMQRRAEQAMKNGWERIEAQPEFERPTYAEVMEDEGGSQGQNQTSYIQGMFIAMDPHSGEVLALIGGRDFNDSRFNRATQARRQPGSVFKPVVYSAAIASGLPASHVIVDAPDVAIEQDDGTIWSPSNYGELFRGPMTLREALMRSVNVVAVKLGIEIGLETVAQKARRFGITTPVPRYESTAIGAAEVVPLEMTAAYTAFVDDGQRVRPRSITRVEDADGRVLWESHPERERSLDPLTNYIVRDMLRHVIDYGTAYNAVRNPVMPTAIPPDIPMGGKTGTTNDNTNVWFVGFSPDLLAGIWFGFDQQETILPLATGGGYAAPVWGEFMHSVYVGDEPLREPPLDDPWPLPADLTLRYVDAESGKLATEWCPTDQIYAEMYRPGTEPGEACDVHGPGLFGAPLRGYTPGEGLRTDSIGTGRLRGRFRPDTPRTDTLPGDTIVPDTVRRDTIGRHTIR